MTSVCHSDREHCQKPVYPPLTKKRKVCIDCGAPANQVSHDLAVLDHKFRGFPPRKISNKQKEGINQAIALIGPATSLPVCFAGQKQIKDFSPLSKAEIGWVLKVPSLSHL